MSDEAGASPPETRALGRVAVLGAGGHAKVVIGALVATRAEPPLLFDDDAKLHGKRVLGLTVAGPLAAAREANADALVIGIGSDRVRARVARDFGAAAWTSVIHPAAWVDTHASIGVGTVVFAGAVVQPAVTIGEHAVINTAASVDHDAVVEDYAHVGPGARLCGGVKLRQGALVGAGATVVPGVEIGAWAVVGAGAVVLSDVPEGATVVGNPARRVDARKQENR